MGRIPGRAIRAGSFSKFGAPRCPPALLLLSLCAPACASNTPAVTVATRAADPDFRPVERQPYTPPPRALGHTDHPSAMIVGSGQSQARATALSFVRALLQGDRGLVHSLLAARIVHVVDGQQVTRAAEVERCLGGADLLSHAPDLVVEDLIQVSAVEVERAEHYHSGMPVPTGIEPSDLVVTLPPQRGSDQLRRAPCLTRVYVRAGAEPRIVGLTR